MMIFNQKTARVQFIFATILLDCIGIGLLIPNFPDIVRRFSADPAVVSKYYGYFIALYALMQFVASPILGSLSDRFGRRPILLVSLLGAALDYLFMAFAPNLPLLFLGRLISGLTGASMTVASAYMADISDDQNRSANFGMIGAAFGVGFIIGPIMGGILSQWGYQAPFLAAAVLNFFNFLFGIFVLPESLPASLRRNIDVKKLNPFASLVKIFKPSPILIFVWIYGILFMAGQVHPSVWTLYTQAKFNWTAKEVGYSLAFVGISVAIVQGGLTRILIPKMGEMRALFWGVGVYVLGFALYGLADRGWMMYAITAVFALSGVAMPALQSIIAKKTSSSEQGELQGSLVSLASLGAILAPIMYTMIFSEFTRAGTEIYLPGAPYIWAAAICGIAWFVAYLASKKVH